MVLEWHKTEISEKDILLEIDRHDGSDLQLEHDCIAVLTLMELHQITLVEDLAHYVIVI